MKLIYNARQQVVSDNYLQAMLHHVSGFAHRYWVERMTPNYCTIAYSNPDEYGTEVPVFLAFPVFRDIAGHTLIVLYPGRVTHGRNPEDRDAAADMMCEAIMNVPDLFRNPSDGEWYIQDERPQE